MWLYETTLVCQTLLLKDGIHGIYIEKVHMFFYELIAEFIQVVLYILDSLQEPNQ
jgi:hypothetical protein